MVSKWPLCKRVKTEKSIFRLLRPSEVGDMSGMVPNGVKTVLHIIAQLYGGLIWF